MNKEYFFISKPRCASTHIYEGLTNWNDKLNGGKPYYHSTAMKMRRLFPTKFDKSFSFSVIRNPYDLVVSWYNEHRKEKYELQTRRFYDMSLDTWINKGCPTHWKHHGFNPLCQYRWVYDQHGRLMVSYLIRLENYKVDMTYVYQTIHKYLPKNVTLETISKTRKNESVSNQDQPLSPQQKDKIYKLFKKDFELFGYLPSDSSVSSDSSVPQ